MEQGREIEKALEVGSAPAHASSDGKGGTYCPICGRDGDPALQRFGQFFCSEAHVAQYGNERRAPADPTPPSLEAGMAKPERGEEAKGMACGIGTGRGLRKIGWCAAGGIGLLIGLPLIASGGLAAAAGSVLSVAALLACPIGMYFMMRGMMKTGQGKRNDHPGGDPDGK